MNSHNYYVGCYEDKIDRDFYVQEHIDHRLVNIKSCYDRCNRYQYFGLQVNIVVVYCSYTSLAYYR